MKRMAERSHHVQISAGLKHSDHLAHGKYWIANMLQHRVALDPRKRRGGKRQQLDARRHIDSRHCENIQIYIAVRPRARPADVQVISA